MPDAEKVNGTCMVGPGDKSVQHPAGSACCFSAQGKEAGLEFVLPFYAVPNEEKANYVWNCWIYWQPKRNGSFD